MKARLVESFMNESPGPKGFANKNYKKEDIPSEYKEYVDLYVETLIELSDIFNDKYRSMLISETPNDLNKIDSELVFSWVESKYNKYQHNDQIAASIIETASVHIAETIEQALRDTNKTKGNSMRYFVDIYVDMAKEALLGIKSSNDAKGFLKNVFGNDNYKISHYTDQQKEWMLGSFISGEMVEEY